MIKKIFFNLLIIIFSSTGFFNICLADQYPVDFKVNARSYSADGGLTPPTLWSSVPQKKIQDFGTFDTNNINKDTWLWGGKTWADPTFIKSTCRTYSEGDEGGVCYEFDNVTGPTSSHRNGTGNQDSVTMGLWGENNSPYLTLGGNGITKNSNGVTTVTGNNVTVVNTANSGSSNLTITGPMSCGMISSGMSCLITANDSIFKNTDGSNSNSAYVTSRPTYNSSSNSSIFSLANGVTLSQNISAGYELTWKVLNPNGIAYGISFIAENRIAIYPKLTQPICDQIRSRMSIYSNIANGMYTSEHITYPTDDTSQIDNPNWYYGFVSQSCYQQSDHTEIVIEANQYPGAAGNRFSWRTLESTSPMPYSNNTSDSTINITTTTDIPSGSNTITLPSNLDDKFLNVKFILSGGITGNASVVNSNTLQLSSPTTTDIPIGSVITLTAIGVDNSTNFYPGNMVGDQLDYKIQTLGSDGQTYTNTNTHKYPAPAIFLGLNNKEFNMYWIQGYQVNNDDAITRQYDNEYDFWIHTDHNGQATSRGATLVWSGTKSVANGSWMERLAGNNLVPLGLEIDGVFPWGGQVIKTDSAFQVIRTTNQLPNGDKTKPILSTMLGAITDSSWNRYNLAYFQNQDNGTDINLHFGIVKYDNQIAGNEMSTNVGCSNCTSEGQLVFNTNGSVSLGSGLGDSYKTGITIDSSGNFHNYNKGFFENGSELYLAEGNGNSFHITYSNGNFNIDDYHGGSYNFGGSMTVYDGIKTTLGNISSSPGGNIRYYGSGGTQFVYVFQDDSNNRLKFWAGNGATADVEFIHNLYVPNTYTDTIQSFKDTKITYSSPVVHYSLNYSSLPTNVNTGSIVFCSDCYSILRNSTDTSHVGIDVMWDGSRWNDLVGNAVKH